MTRFVVLRRGANVGKGSRVPMAAFRIGVGGCGWLPLA